MCANTLKNHDTDFFDNLELFQKMAAKTKYRDRRLIQSYCYTHVTYL